MIEPSKGYEPKPLNHCVAMASSGLSAASEEARTASEHEPLGNPNLQDLPLASVQSATDERGEMQSASLEPGQRLDANVLGAGGPLEQLGNVWWSERANDELRLQHMRPRSFRV